MPSLLQHFISSYQLLAPKTSPFIRSHSMDSVFLGFGNCRFPYDLISLIDLRSLIDFQFIFFSFVVRMWFVICVHAKSLQSYPTHCDLMDHSPPGSFVHRILQARILEWVAMTSSTGSSQPMTWTSSAAPALQVDSLPLSHGGKHGWLFTCSLYITPESRRLTVL